MWTVISTRHGNRIPCVKRGIDFSRADKLFIFVTPKRASAREGSAFDFFSNLFSRRGNLSSFGDEDFGAVPFKST